MKRSSDDIEATTKGEEPRLEIDDSASACFCWLKVQKAILSLQWRKAGHEVWVKKVSSASFYCKVPSLVSRMSSFYKSLVEQGPTTQQQRFAFHFPLEAPNIRFQSWFFPECLPHNTPMIY